MPASRRCCELLAYPAGIEHAHGSGLAVPLRIRAGGQELSLLSTVTTFGTAIDVTLAELSVEAFLPADDTTADTLRALASGRP